MNQLLSPSVAPHEVTPGAQPVVMRRVPIPTKYLKLALCPAQDGDHLPILLADAGG
jgi:hypothetical protein